MPCLFFLEVVIRNSDLNYCFSHLFFPNFACVSPHSSVGRVIFMIYFIKDVAKTESLA